MYVAAGPMRSMSNIVGGLVDLIRIPLGQYRKHGRIVKPIGQAFENLFTHIANETKLFGGSVFHLLFIHSFSHYIINHL